MIVCPTCGHSENEESEKRRIYRHNTHDIENLQIRCRNQFEREQELQLKGNYIECNWKGKLCEYKTHAESTCPFERLAQIRGRTISYYSKSEFASPRKYVKAVESEDLESLCKDMLHLTDDDIENGSDKENEDSKHPSCAVGVKEGSLLNPNVFRLRREADRILSKPFVSYKEENKASMSPPPKQKQPEIVLSPPPKPRDTKRIHDDDMLKSPRPWAMKTAKAKVKTPSSAPQLRKKNNSDAIKAAVRGYDATDSDNTEKKGTSGLDLTKDENGNNTAFLMAAAQILMKKEMSKIQQKDGHRTQDLQGIFVHRYLIDFCRSWMRRKPDALYDFVIYRPKICQLRSSNQTINTLLCGIPGPKRTGWEGGLFPVLLEWNDVDKPPQCCFPKDFHHANVKPTGYVSLSTLKGDWHPEIAIAEILFDLQQLLVHPNHERPAQSEARNSYRKGLYDYKTMIQTSVYVPRSLLEMASRIDGFGPASSWQLVDGEALSSRSGAHNPLFSRPKEPIFTSLQVNGRKACQSYCSCCAWGQTLWDSKREMRYLFGTGGS